MTSRGCSIKLSSSECSLRSTILEPNIRRCLAFAICRLRCSRSTAASLTVSVASQAIQPSISSILSLAYAMGKHTIAEGVVKREQAAMLLRMGCEVAQGYFFSRPVGAEHIPPMLTRSLWRPRHERALHAARPTEGPVRRGHHYLHRRVPRAHRRPDGNQDDRLGMTSLFIGLGNLLLGVAYAGLGSLSAWETITLHRYRGWSRFGVGFSMMAASCGPHHGKVWLACAPGREYFRSDGGSDLDWVAGWTGIPLVALRDCDGWPGRSFGRNLAAPGGAVGRRLHSHSGLVERLGVHAA